MRFRRQRPASAEDAASDPTVTEAETDDAGAAEEPATEDSADETNDAEDGAAEDLDAEDGGDESADDESDDTDDDEADDDESDDDESDDDDTEPERGGLLGWLLPRKKKLDYGKDFSIRVATLPDLEQFPEDGHVHPEIVRSWMALQQFGEAMLLVSWYHEAPAGYVMISWTGDWNDAVRKKHHDVPALCNLWVDEQYAAEGIERKLVEAAVKAVRNQGSKSVVTSVDAEDESAVELYEDLGFKDTGEQTVDAYIYRDSDGNKRRGKHRNAVLMKKF